MKLWSFASLVPQSRIDAMFALESFEAVLDLLAFAEVRCFAWEKYSGTELRGCNRAAFLLETTSDAYDAFFNSPVGLRAQYALSIATGEAANRRLLASLEARLQAFQRSQVAPTNEQVCLSLRASEAKVWIYEDEVQEQLGGAEPEILYRPWATRSESGVGLLAPRGRLLQVMGGWLDPSGVEVPNPRKAGRSAEVHQRGFS